MMCFMPAHDAFLQAVLDAPDDDAPRLIYADWLEEQGDPRGEFIRIQCALAQMDEADDHRWELEARERQLLWQHSKGWAGPVRRYVKKWRFRRGFVEKITIRADRFLACADELMRLAPIRHVRFVAAERFLGDLARCPQLARLSGLDLRHHNHLDAQRLRPLLESKRLKRLNELVLRGTGICNTAGLQALAKSPVLANLTTLDVSDYRRDPARGRQGRRELYSQRDWQHETVADGLTIRGIRALIESSHLKHLRSLALGGYGWSIDVDAIRILVDSPLLGRLTSLDLSHDFPLSIWVEHPVDLLEAISRSRQSAGLRTLGLCRTHITEAGREALAASAYLGELRALHFMDAYFEWEEGPARGLAAAHLPQLRQLHVAHDNFGDNALKALALAKGLPKLRVLALEDVGVGAEGIRGLIKASLVQQLRVLIMSGTGSKHYSYRGSKAAQLLASSPDTANLVHLNLANQDLDDAAARAIARSPHLSRLRTLDLWHNRIGDKGIKALTTSANLLNLAHVDLRGNPLSVAGQRLLCKRFGPGGRYGPGKLLAQDRAD
jgi:uncharacterized protein (TIGR02996 family)